MEYDGQTTEMAHAIELRLIDSQNNRVDNKTIETFAEASNNHFQLTQYSKANWLTALTKDKGQMTNDKNN